VSHLWSVRNGEDGITPVAARLPTTLQQSGSPTEKGACMKALKELMLQSSSVAPKATHSEAAIMVHKMQQIFLNPIALKALLTPETPCSSRQWFWDSVMSGTNGKYMSGLLCSQLDNEPGQGTCYSVWWSLKFYTLIKASSRSWPDRPATQTAKKWCESPALTAAASVLGTTTPYQCHQCPPSQNVSKYQVTRPASSLSLRFSHYAEIIIM
jgi:hypothetical protein